MRTQRCDSGHWYVVTADEFCPLCRLDEGATEIQRLRAALLKRETETVPSSEFQRACADRDSYSDRLDAYKKLCPSMTELDSGEQLHPESTITVGVGYLHTLLEQGRRLHNGLEVARLLVDWDAAYDRGDTGFASIFDIVPVAKAALEPAPSAPSEAPLCEHGWPRDKCTNDHVSAPSEGEKP